MILVRVIFCVVGHNTVRRVYKREQEKSYSSLFFSVATALGKSEFGIFTFEAFVLA
jgi:hypothetical protein